MAALNFARLPKPSRGSTRAVRATVTEVWFEANKTDNLPYPQCYFFDNATGQVTFDASIELRDGFIVRRVDRWLSGKPHENMRGWISGWMANNPEDFNLDTEELTLTNGKLLLPATQSKKSSTWVILVHGRTAKRAETYRALQIFSDLGLSALAVSLRNNFEASTARDRRSHFGFLEWQDVAAAVSHARKEGAENIIFYAISMGAISVAECIRNSHETFAGVILDSPVVNWRETLEVMARKNQLTVAQQNKAVWFIESWLGSKLLRLKKPVQLRELGFANWCSNFELPILLMHSEDDGYVDYEPSQSFALAHQEFVKLETFDTALHVQLWNYQPERYRQLLSEFVAKLPI